MTYSFDTTPPAMTLAELNRIAQDYKYTVKYEYRNPTDSAPSYVIYGGGFVVTSWPTIREAYKFITGN